MNENEKPQEVEDVLLATEFLPLLEQEAQRKGLNVYVFGYDEVTPYFGLKSDKLSIALLAKDEDNARYNLRNLRRCYLIRTENEIEEVTDSGDSIT
jgi:hypothetical protein